MGLYEILSSLMIVSGIICVFISYRINDSNINNIIKSENKNFITKEGLDEILSEYSIDEDIKLVNDKILELNEYAEFIKSEIEKKHKELLFLYQMVAEKEKSISPKEELTYKEIEKKEITKLDETINKNLENEDNKEIEEKEVYNINIKIIELSNKGYGITEIAQILNIGQGEVKLVLDLYK